LVTHDQEEALIMSDRIAVMFDGEIAQVAAPQELYRRPVTRRVGEFIGVMNFLDAQHLDDGAEGVRFQVEGLGEARISHEQLPQGARAFAPVLGLRPEALSVIYDAPVEPGARVVEGEVIDLSNSSTTPWLIAQI